MTADEVGQHWDEVLPRTAARVERWHGDELIQHGIQLYVSFQGSLVVDLGLGEARPGLEMTPHTISRQYCNMAPLTAFALAQLVSRGLVGLDQPVAYFLPPFGTGGKDRVTLRHVLTHTAGLHRCDERCMRDSEADITNAICEEPLAAGWVPGARAAYSAVAGWQVIGSVVETVTGLPIRQHLRAVSLALGMSGTWVGIRDDDYDALRDGLGVLYYGGEHQHLDGRRAPGRAAWHDLSREVCALALCSGGYGPARDLGRFYDVLLDADRLATDGLVSPEVLRQFVAPQRSGMYDEGLGRVCDYGLGFMVNVRDHRFGDYCSVRSYGHSGIGGSSLAFADEDERLVIALFSNDILDWQTCFLRRVGIVNAIYQDLGVGGDRSEP